MGMGKQYICVYTYRGVEKYKMRSHRLHEQATFKNTP